MHLDNLIVNDENILTGVIDFGNMEFYVPEIEFALMTRNEIIQNSALENYPGQILIRDVRFLQILHRTRYFKHSIYWDEEKKQKEVTAFRKLLDGYKI